MQWRALGGARAHRGSTKGHARRSKRLIRPRLPPPRPHQDLESRIAAAREGMDTATQEAEEQRQRVARLQDELRLAGAGASGAGGHQALAPDSGNSRRPAKPTSTSAFRPADRARPVPPRRTPTPRLASLASSGAATREAELQERLLDLGAFVEVVSASAGEGGLQGWSPTQPNTPTCDPPPAPRRPPPAPQVTTYSLDGPAVDPDQLRKAEARARLEVSSLQKQLQARGPGGGVAGRPGAAAAARRAQHLATPSPPLGASKPVHHWPPAPSSCAPHFPLHTRNAHRATSFRRS
jgi:hypothetical protein